MNGLHSSSGPRRESIAPRHESLRKEFDGEIGYQPREYAEARLWIVARDAHWIFAYWEFDPKEHPEAVGADGVARFFVRLLRGDGSVEVTQEISPMAGDLFIRVGVPDAEYSGELGFYTEDRTWCFLAHSGTTRTPEETGGEMASAAADNGKGMRSVRALLAGETRDGEPVRKAAERVRGGGEWSDEQEAMLARLLAADSARVEAGRRRKR